MRLSLLLFGSFLLALAPVAAEEICGEPERLVAALLEPGKELEIIPDAAKVKAAGLTVEAIRKACVGRRLTHNVFNVRVGKPAPTTAVSSDASKELLQEFQRSYALPDGKVLRRMAPPCSPGRMEYYRVHHAEEAKIDPEGPEIMWFCWGDGKPGVLDPYREGKLTKGGTWRGDKSGQSVAGILTWFVRVESYEIEGDWKFKWAHIPGDWVVRDGVPDEKIVQELEAVLREECKMPVRLHLGERDRQIIVAEGKYVYRPLPGRSTVTEDHKYGYEGSDLQDYDPLEIFEHDRDGLSETNSGSLSELLLFLTRYLDRPVIDEGVDLPTDMKSTKRRNGNIAWSGNIDAT